MKKINPGHVLVAGCCLALMLGVGFGIGITLKATQASRNSAGTYSLFNAPVTSLQVITPSLWNNNFNDLAADMTLSLDRNGRGGMLAPLRSVDGTLAAPSFSFTSETGSGLFRNGAGDVRMSILGALREQWLATGIEVTGASGGLSTVNSNTASASQQARFMMRAQGVDKWGLLKQTDESVLLFDYVNSRTIWHVATGATAPFVMDAGATVGASGTAISQSNRGTASLTPAAIPTQQCQSQAITVTGAVNGTECAYGIPAAGNPGLSIACASGTNGCTLTLCNPTAGSLTPPTGTYTCRVFNP